MPRNDVQSLVANVFMDMVSLVTNLPMGAATEVFQRFMRENAEFAREKLLEEIRQRGPEAAIGSDDEVLRCLFRYGLAARDGIARQNMALLAKVLVGHMHKDALYASEFARHADVLSRLSRNAILAAGQYAKFWTENGNVVDGRTNGSEVDRQISTRQNLEQWARENAVGVERMEGYLAECAGSGLLRPAVGIDMQGYYPTPTLFELISLAGENGFVDAVDV